MRILLTGASGAVGSALAPSLAAAGHEVRAFTRDPARVTAPGVSSIASGDMLTGAGLDAALAGIEVAYYLVHSMESSAGESRTLAERERQSATAFRVASIRAGVRRVVYLGGIVPAGRPGSEHLDSRLGVERVLLDAAPEAVALRASIVLSAASRSFRFLVRLAERVPVLLLPRWRDHVTQPIDGRDVVALLHAAGTRSDLHGRHSLDIAGPEVLSYGALLERIADAMLIQRPKVCLPLTLTPVASVIAAAIAGEDVALIEPLMRGLDGDLLPRDSRAHALFDVRLHRIDAAIERALRDWELIEPLRAR